MQGVQQEKIVSNIEQYFRKQVRNDQKLKSGFLTVHSEKHGIDLNLIEGMTDRKQPVYMASVGKMFTSVLISMLYEKGYLTFEDSIITYLDPSLIENLHIYEGKDYTRM